MLNSQLATKTKRIGNPKKLASIALMIGALMSASVAVAQHAGPQNKMFKIFRTLDLSDSQREDIRTIITEAKQTGEVYRADIRLLMSELRAMVHAEDFQPEQVSVLFADNKESVQAMSWQRLQTMSEIKSVLNEEQQAELRQKMQRFARGSKGGKDSRPDMGALLEELDLSEEQLQTVPPALADARLAKKQVQMLLRGQKRSQRAFLVAETIDETTWQQIFDEQYAEVERLAIRAIEKQRAVRALLTDEQKELLAEKIEARMAKIRERMEGL